MSNEDLARAKLAEVDIRVGILVSGSILLADDLLGDADEQPRVSHSLSAEVGE